MFAIYFEHETTRQLTYFARIEEYEDGANLGINQWISCSGMEYASIRNVLYVKGIPSKSVVLVNHGGLFVFGTLATYTSYFQRTHEELTRIDTPRVSFIYDVVRNCVACIIIRKWA